jgi:MoaA/NifB/PqqE/SkfB family radical SAM enzyme
MAKIIEAKELRAKRTDKLVDVIPLSTPWSLFLEITNTCNFRCAY